MSWLLRYRIQLYIRNSIWFFPALSIVAGLVISGLVGRRKFIYLLWGDTVKLAWGIKSDGKTSILVTHPVYERVRDLVAFGSATRVDVRGMGPVELFSMLDEATV
jgi:adenylate cyclase